MNDFAYDINSRNEITIIDYTGSNPEVVIPSEINGCPVKHIAHGAFTLREITSVYIPNSIVNIEWGAFEGCEKLTSITIPSSVRNIGAYALSGCDNLEKINVSADNKYYASQDGVLFSKDKTKLICYPGGKHGTYTIPDGVTTIADYAFQYCNNLTSINFSDSVKYIGRFAFACCDGLTSITIPNNVKNMGEGAFDSCNGLISATILNGITNIEQSVFGYCSNLKSVILGCNVTNIGRFAFGCCRKLTSIIISNNVTSIKYDAFNDCPSDLTIKCHPNSFAEQWAIKNGFRTEPIMSELQRLLNKTSLSINENNHLHSVPGRGDHDEI